ncbi:MAG: ankyrin repeat domain-containing protein [Methylococcaceae bacterium]
MSYNEIPAAIDTPCLQWIEALNNPWGIRLLDLRPITQDMMSACPDPQMAINAQSYQADDGMSFIHDMPDSGNEITAHLIFNIDKMLAPGVLYIPHEMEHKWAIYYYDNRIIFVRSWLRKVMVVADTTQDNGRLYIHKIMGQFSEEGDPDFIRSIVKFLLITHVIGEDFPAPLPKCLSSDLESAGLWAMSLYGIMARVGTFISSFEGSTVSPVRSHSLLHIATARHDLDEMRRQLEQGIPIDLLAADGLAPLHWVTASGDIKAMQFLIVSGANPDVRSVQNTTPLMNAVEANCLPQVRLLLDSGADINACDIRGFTSVHRAAEMGHIELLELLLNHGANPNPLAEGHTPLSLAEQRGEKDIVQILLYATNPA